ncbi:RpiR family transcriptional regulator [Lachnospiraceae bacterium]|uniref:MurR/RpiR family transcriptional regulator n=1 Tax=Extibacter sp. GGCC_0201 TaxID=2731209 RepID=UPI001AA13466|nr:MurR/RpiR family transcriptional regulator [Extibacter sp. GGCC_0201]MBO1722669.1 MurR/RpiR family transcriptional regulator [Extibacter sp. GGCC_0201]BDF34868.1 RpiR family transcriptional regulator [Lachnospiraceae bacterium]BDF38869.1 RpiR family transcriptional regulator [Lachnospiraceae bacterium]
MKELRETINNANLTKTQKMIARYVLDNSADACFMTSTEIALKLGVSESSVIRFSRSLGFDGFMDFQKSLRKDYQDKVLSISSSITVPSQRVAKRAKLDTSSDYINRHFKNTAKNMESVFVNNSTALFEEAAEAIISSKRKYIISSRGNSCLGDYFLLYLKHMLPNVEMTNSAAISPVDHMCNISKDDCVVAFSFPRYSSIDKISVMMAYEVGAKIIVVTDKPSALLAQYATVLFTVPVDSNTFFNSLVAPQFVAEALLDTISHKVKGIERRLKKIDKYLGELGNY